MKKNLFIIFTLIVTLQVYSQAALEGDYSGWIGSFIDGKEVGASIANYKFQNNQYSLSASGDGDLLASTLKSDDISDGMYVESGRFLISKQGLLSYINFYSSSRVNLIKKYGILYSEKCLFLFNENGEVYFEPDENYRFSGSGPSIENVHSSSALREGAVTYNGENFIDGKYSKLKPWVEAAPGYGIGEWIELNISAQQIPLHYFLISNGYVDFKRTDLYSKNSRIRKLNIIIEKSNINMVVELADMPDFQKVMLPHEITGNIDVKFIILDVYKGDRWEDTCLNMIYPMGDIASYLKIMRTYNK